MDEQTRIGELTVGELVTLIRETVKDELRASLTPDADIPQHEKLKALLDSWAQEPDDKSEAWWADFDESLKQNRFRLRTDEA